MPVSVCCGMEAGACAPTLPFKLSISFRLSVLGMEIGMMAVVC